MKRLLMPALVLLLSVSLSGCLASGVTQPQPSGQTPPAETVQPVDEDAEAAVRAVVDEFGRRLQAVSLLAPAETVSKSMQEQYGGLVTPELLADWQADPQSAPGRLTSSPWPDRIEILDATRREDVTYEVRGEIIEVTSTGTAAKRPLSLVVKRAGNRWLIAAVTLGPYGNDDSIGYGNKEYGFRLSLPESWRGYEIVTERWEGVPATGAADGKASETGPLLRIRHPEWTAQDPRQDIPIMIFTLSQWNALQEGAFHIGAAPVGPTELGRNSKYVFALPARYNYAFPAGYEEVEEILAGKPLQAIEPFSD